MSNNVDLLEKLQKLGLLDKVQALVKDAEEEEEEKKVRGKLTSVISQALTDLGITDKNGVIESWPFPGKALVIKLFDNGDSGVVIDIRRETLGAKGKGRKRSGGCRAEKDGRVVVGPTYADIARYLGIDFSGMSAGKGLEKDGWRIERVDEEYTEVRELK